MPKRICHISPVSIHSTRWIEAFREKGWDVSLITDFQTWVAEKPRRVPIYVLPTLILGNAHRRFVPNYVSIMKIFQQIRPDVVHLHIQHHYAPVVSRFGSPYILHSWGMEILELHRMSVFRKILSKYAATRAERIVVDAECMKKIWMSIGVSGNKIDVIPFGVDTKAFRPGAADERAVRRRLDIRTSDVVVISTRPFFPHYNIDCLIRAVPLIVKRHGNVKFIVKGRGPLEVSARNLARRLGVEGFVRFTSPVPFREVVDYLSAADIYVSTSFVDSTSVSLLEAMACGLPPVTTDIVGNREWVRDGVNGLLFAPRDYNVLADKIVQLVENAALRKRFGEKSRGVVLERAAWEKCVSRMEVLYNGIS